MAKLTWQLDSARRDNGDNLTAIGQWWGSLHNQEVVLAQRLMPLRGAAADLDWNPQRFDERFVIHSPQLRGATLYWCKPSASEERNFSPHKLEFDSRRQQLYVYPRSQAQLVVRIELLRERYERLTFENPAIVGTTDGNTCILLMRDKDQHLEIKLVLDRDRLAMLRAALPADEPLEKMPD
ncbi:hypothetical protein KR51_00024040 [Rubidibacter lacunae KORDI 51-2]|uniref:Uncharacterized protein n=1 Tax=Rubidibacter lacunae KORDI 51-2 TaxID=582515 RepID=U5DN78_9CHRO|nr:hypothetical protein [Rubidibacter lacunae]ERN41140.1 hypothetical protein KR51_00024040 [Rubidibacter lacunae KORDI 51-2]